MFIKIFSKSAKKQQQLISGVSITFICKVLKVLKVLFVITKQKKRKIQEVIKNKNIG